MLQIVLLAGKFVFLLVLYLFICAGHTLREPRPAPTRSPRPAGKPTGPPTPAGKRWGTWPGPLIAPGSDLDPRGG